MNKGIFIPSHKANTQVHLLRVTIINVSCILEFKVLKIIFLKNKMHIRIIKYKI